DGLITVSHAPQKKIEQRFGIHADVVYNTVHDSVRMRDVHKPEDGKAHFITVGALLPVKGFDNLISAFAQSSLPRDKWKLTIVGEGPEESTLRTLITQNGLEQNITLSGRKSKEEVVEMLNRSDVFVSSSHLETFGVAALEAICCGVPVLSTDSGGPREFINESNGYLCEDSLQDLQKGIEYMYSHYHDFDKKRMAEEAVKRFSSATIAHQLENIFKKYIL
ncbi:MAG: glycosyltransferase, partial [Paludibacteraceae bacterium]|nr:glycosyltransferase [Paludibacteraceae bacterium]